MYEKSTSSYLETVFELARQNQIDHLDIELAGSDADGLRDLQEWQQEALNTVADIITNYSDELDSLNIDPSHAKIFEHDFFHVDLSEDPSVSFNAFRIVLSLAQDNAFVANITDDEPLQDQMKDQINSISYFQEFLLTHKDNLPNIRINTASL